MKKDYIQVSGKEFIVNGKKIILRGFGIGSWMNIEHFMIGLPGTEQMIRNLFIEVYGIEKSEEFFDLYLSSFLTEDDFRFLKGLGVNALRLAVNYHHFLNDHKYGDINKKGFFHLDRVLEFCKKYGIYAILDLHATPGGQNPDWHADNDTGVPLFWNYACFREQVIILWAHIAEHYSENSYIAGYDIINEPCLVPDKGIFNSFITGVIHAIRKFDKNHIIFLEGDDWGKDFSIFDSIDDPQLAYSFHLYPFFILENRNPGKWSREALKKAVAPFIRLREEKQRPLWCGETGNRLSKKYIRKQIAVLKQMLDIYEENDISWSVWSYKDAGTMSLLYTAEHTPWHHFVADFRKRWDLNKELNQANKMLHLLSKKMDRHLRYRMHFRMRGILQNIYFEQLVKPKISRIPWDEIKEYPLSFHYTNCHKWDEAATLIASYTGKVQHSFNFRY
ncbi:MAG: cellulase family glycosylhydrolase [Spirochaetales bacterium]|nr:cellulase family glycosylhydrolase [Spirochaetales bacterium]